MSALGPTSSTRNYYQSKNDNAWWPIAPTTELKQGANTPSLPARSDCLNRKRLGCLSDLRSCHDLRPWFECAQPFFLSSHGVVSVNAGTFHRRVRAKRAVCLRRCSFHDPAFRMMVSGVEVAWSRMIGNLAFVTFGLIAQNAANVVAKGNTLS